MKSLVIDRLNSPKNIYDLLSAYKNQYGNDWIIAGGFARLIGHAVLDIEWGKGRNLFEYIKHDGDIDFFANSKNCNTNLAILETECSINCVTNIINSYNQDSENLKFDITSFSSEFAENSYTTFYARNKSKYTKSHRLALKKQFITKFSYNNIEEMSQNFDITNSQWFITFDNNKINLVYSEKARELDEKKLIDINDNITNPYLAKRINKYVTLRGLSNGLNEDSKDNFNHFLISAATDSWKDEFVKLMVSEDVINLSSYPAKTLYSRAKSHMTFEALNRLLKINMLSKNNLTLFIGRWKTTVLENQGSAYSENSPVKMFPLDDIYTNKYKEVDWASHNINLLS